MMLFRKSMLWSGVALVVLAAPGYAAEPLVLSNDPGLSMDPIDQPSRGAPRGTLYWDVKQVDGRPGTCMASKSMGDQASIRVVGGNFAVTQIEARSDRFNLARIATAPVTMSFDRTLPPIMATGQVQGPSTIIFTLPDPRGAYDVLQQASAARVSVTVGDVTRGATYDLVGLKTALAELEMCVDTAPTAPMPAPLVRSEPPPVPSRTPQAILNNFRGELPDVTSGAGASIPPLEWPELEATGNTRRLSSVPIDTPIASPRVRPMAVTAPAQPIDPNDPYSPTRARMIDGQGEGAIAAPLIPMKSPTSIIPTQPDPQLVVSGPVQEAAPSRVNRTEIMRQGSGPVLDTFRARKGESLRDVLRRWADRAGIDLVWNMPGDITLVKDYSYVGPFDRAVAGLVAAYPESGIKTRLENQGVAFERQPFVEEMRAPAVAPMASVGPPLDDFAPMPQMLPAAPPPAASLPRYQTPAPRMVTAPLPRPILDGPPPRLAAPASVTAGVATTQVGPVRRWRALSGASMRQVLEAWSEDAQIRLVWLAPQDFAVRYSINKSTAFSQGVQDLLAQYAFEPVRPMGQIYRDPTTDQAILVVRSGRP
jgi:hypothetical protein